MVPEVPAQNGASCVAKSNCACWRRPLRVALHCLGTDSSVPPRPPILGELMHRGLKISVVNLGALDPMLPCCLEPGQALPADNEKSPSFGPSSTESRNLRR